MNVCYDIMSHIVQVTVEPAIYRKLSILYDISQNVDSIKLS